MENVSIVIILLFSLATIITLLIFFKAAHYSKRLMAVVLVWLIIQSALGILGFYSNWTAIPPRFPLLIAPPVLAIVLLLALKGGRSFVDTLNIETLTILHVIRIPVEITLYYLLMARLIPQSMTFEGTNLDIVSGITAPIVYYFAFSLKRMHPRILLIWNFVCLALLLNVVITAILSAPTPFQKFAFDQPNIGIGYFPFVLLPAVLVPIVLFSHLASIRQLIKRPTMVKANLGNV